MAGVTLPEALRIGTAAVLAGFRAPHDSRDRPPKDEYTPIPASYLRQYDVSQDTLDMYGLTIIDGVVGDSYKDEDALLDAAVEWERRHPRMSRPNPLLFEPPRHQAAANRPCPVLPKGYSYVRLPSRRMTPPPPPRARRVVVNGRTIVKYEYV